jgi:hypothetical protein
MTFDTHMSIKITIKSKKALGKRREKIRKFEYKGQKKNLP